MLVKFNATSNSVQRKRGRVFACIFEYLRNRNGNIATSFAVAIPVFLAFSGGVIDYSVALKTRSTMQAAADAAALGAARELRMANPNAQIIADVARTLAVANLGSLADAQVQAATDNNFTYVQVQIDKDIPSSFGPLSPFGASHVQVQARARLRAGTATCMLALDSSTSSTLGLDAASLRAPECAVYSNAAVFDGLALTNGGKISARFICSAGGATGSSSGYTPTPRLDCPALKDPFASRAQPAADVCTTTNLIVSGGSRTLTPGVYCGGLKITTGAAVTLSPGVYVLKNGPLVVDKQSSLTADGAGFFLTGANAVLAIDDTTTVNMKAPSSGPLAGMLFFEDRSVPVGQTHLFGSRNAPQLLGTFYLSRNKLVVGYAPTTPGTAIANCNNIPNFQGQCPPLATSLATQSAWTIVVARQVAINGGVNLVLNSNYTGSAVQPPPEVVLPTPALIN